MTNIETIRAAARTMLDAFGGDVPDWLRADALALSTALDMPDDPVRIVVAMEGGLIQGIVSSVPVEATTIDYDDEGFDETDEALRSIPQHGGGTADALRYTFAADVDPEWITRAVAAERPACGDCGAPAGEAHETPCATFEFRAAPAAA